MRRALAFITSLVVLLSAVGATRQASFRAGTHLVVLFATALDANGHLDVSLNRDDFEVRDNGRPVDLALFSKDPQPIDVAVLLDMSDSMRPRLRVVRDGARQFIEALTPADRAVIGTFSQEVAIPNALTASHADLERVLTTELWPSGGSLLWAAVDQAMTVLGAPQTSRRRVVLVMSDGVDLCPRAFLGSTCKTEREVRARAVSDEFMVYAVGIAGTNREAWAKVPESDGKSGTMISAPVPMRLDLPNLAAETGGGHFRAEPSDVAATFASIADELRHQYVLGFSPSRLDNATHKLEVRVKRGHVTVRARQSYVAKADR
jgi:Ca-activated chloride channel family protein